MCIHTHWLQRQNTKGIFIKKWKRNTSYWGSPFLKDYTPWEGPTLGQFVKDSRWSSLCRTVSREREPTPEQGQRARSPPLRRKERQRQRVMNWPQPPFPVPLSYSRGGGREFGSEAEPGKKGEVGGRCFKICFYFSLPYSDLIGDKLNYPFLSRFSLFCPWW